MFKSIDLISSPKLPIVTMILIAFHIELLSLPNLAWMREIIACSISSITWLTFEPGNARYQGSKTILGIHNLKENFIAMKVAFFKWQ